MTPTKCLDILILKTPPTSAHLCGRDPGGIEIWQGGATDRATRTMIVHPPYWLLLADVDPNETESAAPAADGVLLTWRATEIQRREDAPGYRAGGVILVSMDVDPDHEDEFNDWYNTEHIPLLKGVPGVYMARRFRAPADSPRYVALYHVDDTAAYNLPSWKRANETPWILRMRRFQTNRTYFMFGTRCDIPGPDTGASKQSRERL